MIWLSKPKPETLDMLFELAKEAPEGQLRASDAVDSKIFQAFAASSVLIGLAAVHGVESGKLETTFVSIAVAAFLVGAGAATWALWSRRYRVGMGPGQLWEKYWSDDPMEIKHAFVDDIASGYTENEKHIADKHKAFRWALVALIVEAASIGAALIDSAA